MTNYSSVDVLHLNSRNDFVLYRMDDIYNSLTSINNLVKYKDYYFNVIIPYGCINIKSEYRILSLTEEQFINIVINGTVYETFSDIFLHYYELKKDRCLDNIMCLCKIGVRNIKISHIV